MVGLLRRADLQCVAVGEQAEDDGSSLDEDATRKVNELLAARLHARRAATSVRSPPPFFPRPQTADHPRPPPTTISPPAGVQMRDRFWSTTMTITTWAG